MCSLSSLVLGFSLEQNAIMCVFLLPSFTLPCFCSSAVPSHVFSFLTRLLGSLVIVCASVLPLFPSTI